MSRSDISDLGDRDSVLHLDGDEQFNPAETQEMVQNLVYAVLSSSSETIQEFAVEYEEEEEDSVRLKDEGLQFSMLLYELEGLCASSRVEAGEFLPKKNYKELSSVEHILAAMSSQRKSCRIAKTDCLTTPFRSRKTT